ncbi:MAG: phosphomannomutase/phosphoglucomutase [Desulfobacterales bacterium]|nr:phosphomannomutase/phosphoglucomutase [Desulfobacterales bacterium]MDX2510486.1 phosphomannomutase/phosphoglucomutase [Desulfobacterales bacterium]
MLNPHMFREYDIRGIAGKDMDAADVVLIGKAIGTYLRRQGNTDITVGRDCRVTSDQYSEKLIQGLMATGCHVMDIGVCSTPVGYFSIRHLNKQGNVMVTASHNPPEYNGFKVCSGVDSVFGEQIQKILELINNEDFENGTGTVETFDILTPYKDYLVKNITLTRSLRVGIDAGNGTAGVTAVPIIKDLGCEVHDLYCEPDGSFPNHEADPTVLGNMQDLIALVKEEKLDVGFGYDGDGDRIGVVDAEGNLIYGDKLMIIFSREILSRKPGATFISEVKCSKTLYDDIEKNGGRAIMWKTGHSLIKQKMKVEKAELAGEMSGHIFFSDRYFGFDDAVYASCRLLEILSSTGKKISDLLADIPETVSTPEIRVECPDHIKFAVVEKVTAYFKERHDVIDIDGVRVLFPDGWGLVRASNTQPALVLRFEAITENRLQEIRELVETVLRDIQKQIQ